MASHFLSFSLFVMLSIAFAMPGNSSEVAPLTEEKKQLTLARHFSVSMIRYRSEEGVSVGLAEYIANLSETNIREKGSFSVVLSGGSLIHTLRHLFESPHVNSIDWSKWLVFWVDERVVPLTDPQSNYKLAYDGFLSKVPIPASNIYPINDTLSTEDAAEEYEARLRRLVEDRVIDSSPSDRVPKFDLMLLGMGPEGHVASLFCWHFQRFEKKRWVTFIKDSPKPPSERITFTFPVINSAWNIALVITGEEVADAVKAAFGPNAFDYYPLPVQKVRPIYGNITWFMDLDATSQVWDDWP